MTDGTFYKEIGVFGTLAASTANVEEEVLLPSKFLAVNLNLYVKPGVSCLDVV